MTPTKKKTGRPLKIDEKIIRKLVEGFQNDFTVEEAYAAQDFPFIAAKNRVFRGMKAGGPEAANLALKFLERRQRDRYSPKIINEMTGGLTLGYGEIESAPKATSPEEARTMAEGEVE